MKRKFVSKLLIGVLTLSMLVPCVSQAAAQTQAVSQETGAQTSIPGTWIASGNRWWYRHSDGSYTKSGWEKIDGLWYYFDAAGWMTTGWQLVNGTWYYMDGSGKMLTGWQWVNGKCYYLTESGAMAANTWIGGYYVDGSGAWIPGKQQQNSWIRSGNRWWYQHGDGSYTKSNWEAINGHWYYFDEEGWMVVGWRLVNGVWYYMDSSGKMLTGWQWINGRCYYLDASGAMAANTWIGEYYVDGSGAWIPNMGPAGWVASGNRWWYRHSDGGYTRSNWEKIDGKIYYFDAEGWMMVGWVQVNGNWYYMNAGGAMVTGWLRLNSGLYYLNENGMMLTGWQEIDGKDHYFYQDGNMAANTWIGDRYVNGDGVWVETGSWAQSGGRWYYINQDGSNPKSTWKTIGDQEYYFDAEGWMVTGWLQLDGTWYYLESNGAKAYGKWVGAEGIGGYYISKYGEMVANDTYSLGDYIYSFDGNGLCYGMEDRYVWATDPKNGKSYKLERQFQTDPQVGVSVSEDEFLAAAVYTEAGNQGMPGMTGVAMVMLNRMNSSAYPDSAQFLIYQAGQFEVARNGTLTYWLQNKDSASLNNAKAAVAAARAIMNNYLAYGTPRTVEGLTMPAGKTDFDYEGFMTPKAFDNAGLDWEKTEAFTYLNTTFYTTWIKK